MAPLDVPVHYGCTAPDLMKEVLHGHLIEFHGIVQFYRPTTSRRPIPHSRDLLNRTEALVFVPSLFVGNHLRLNDFTLCDADDDSAFWNATRAWWELEGCWDWDRSVAFLLFYKRNNIYAQ